LWALEKLRSRTLIGALRAWQLPLAVYLALALMSASEAVPGQGGSFKTVLLMAELAALAVISADFASVPERRRAIARVIIASSLVTVLLAVVGLILFYARVSNGLIGSYGDYTPSHLYARVRAGFESAPLLASYCIFASGIVASADARLTRRTRIATQVALGLMCAATLSRGILGFLLAATLRRAASIEHRRRVLVSLAAGAVGMAVMALLTFGQLSGDPVKPSTISYSLGHGRRYDAFTSSFTTLRHHPLLGIGPGALPGFNELGPARAHFTPLNIAATVGLPALAALIAMLWLLWRGRRRPTDLALWGSAAGIALDGLGQDIDHFRHVWLLIGLLGARGSPVSRSTPSTVAISAESRVAA
jgi:hypothetical protein